MSERWVLWALVALLALPTVLAHGGVEDEDREAAQAPIDRTGPPIAPAGYTGPGREPYISYFEGVWLYGRSSATSLEAQAPTSLDADGDWVVWEDANRSDIFAYSVSAQQGYFVTSDAFPQHRPRVSDNVIVYEDHRSPGKPAIYAYFLDTGETRRLSNTTRASRTPDIDFPVVAWLDDNITNSDVWAHSLANHTTWMVHGGIDRDSDPLVLEERVFWRSYRYNLWDVVGYDTRSGDEIQVTSDGAIQSAPFTNGEALLYLTNAFTSGWQVERFDLDTDTPTRLSFTVPDSGRTSASGDALLRVAQDVDYAQLVVRNLTSGATNHVSGNLLLTSAPIISERTIFASVRTHEGVSLLQLQVSPFAFAKRPTLTIASPSDRMPWLRPVAVSGMLEAGPDFTEPVTFTYRLDDQPPQIIPAGERWRFTLDPAGVEPGEHVVTVRATFREGPPVVSGITLLVPAPSQTVDVERLGPVFHAGRLLNELNVYVLDNPASWIIIPLALAILALIVLRIWLWLAPRRKRAVVEYVAPDEGYA